MHLESGKAAEVDHLVEGDVTVDDLAVFDHVFDDALICEIRREN